MSMQGTVPSHPGDHALGSHARQHAQVIPRGMIVGAGVLILFTILSAAYARLSGFDATPQAPTAVVEQRVLTFTDRPDGSVAVLEGGVLVGAVAPGGDGFVRGVLRALSRDRKVAGIAPDTPFHLVRWADGRLTVEDPATGHVVEVNAFGKDNLEAFARLLDSY